MPYSRNISFAALYNTGDAVEKIARIATGNSGWIDIGDAKDIVAQLDSAGGTGTTPTLDVKFQTSFNGSDTTAIDVLTGAFTQVTTVASAQLRALTTVHRYIKIIWTVTGVTPSFNFGVYVTTK